MHNRETDVLQNWTHLSGHQLGNLPDRTVAICPLGAVESHGPHLPTGTDTLIADGILDAIAEPDVANFSALRLPALWLGASLEHTSKSGTLSSPATRLIETIADLAARVADHGVKRLILLSAHGGNNAAARIAALEARAQHGLLCAAAHWMDFGLPANLKAPAPIRQDAHGGWIETSMMMSIAPELVRTPLPEPSNKAAPAPLLFPNGPIHWGWMSEDLGDDGYIGAPHLASQDLGDQLVTHAATSVAGLIRHMASADWPLPHTDS